MAGWGSGSTPKAVSSFWERLGNIGEKAVVGAFDSARSTFADPNANSDNNDFTAIGNWALSHVIKPVSNSDIAHTVMKPIVWSMNEASHGIAAGWSVGDVAQANGGSDWTPFHSAQAWKDAWNATNDISGGEAIAQSFLASYKPHGGFSNLWGPAPVPGGMFGSTPANKEQRAQFDEWRKTAAGRITSGALDVIVTWPADPTLIAGKAAKAARVANAIEDSAKAEDVSKAFTDANLAANPAGNFATVRGGVFSSTPKESASRLSALVAKTDNMTPEQTVAHFAPIVARNADVGPVLDLISQASRITDVTVQRQVKADILLSSAGSKAARERLIETAPAIARSTERASEALPEFATLDRLASEVDGATGILYRRGDALTEAARAIGDRTGNAAEIEAYGQNLDSIHRQMRDVFAAGEAGMGSERVGATALDRAKAAARSRTAMQFYFQDGVAGRTVRALHWAADQRSRGVIATNDPVRGHDELMDTLARSGLYDGAARRDVAQKWWGASGQNLKNKVVDDLWGDMIARAGAKHGLNPDQVKEIIDQVVVARGKGRAYTAAQMEKARAAGLSRVTLDDPVTGTATSIDRALFEPHLRNNVALPDTDLIERTIRHVQDKGTLTDKVSSAREDILSAGNTMNDWWRLGVLARPGLLIRTQLDSQARSVAMLGATTVMHQAILGAGHKIGQVLGREQVIDVSARAEDILRQRDMVDQAAELRRQASIMSGDKAQRLLDRASTLEAEAAKPITHKVFDKHLGVKDKNIKLGNGVTAKTRAYTSEVDRTTMAPALTTGDVSIADALMNLSGKIQSKFTEQSGDWISKSADSSKWAGTYARHVDALRQSYTGSKVLREADHPTADLVKSLRDDPAVRKEWLDVRFDNPNFDDWLDRVIHEAAYVAPTPELRQAIVGGTRMGEKDVEGMFAKAGDETSTLPKRMDITGPAMAAYSKSDGFVKDALQNVVRLMSDVPDLQMARHPLYVGSYYKHFTALAKREVDRTGELSVDAQAKIEKSARHRAIQDVRQTMYDTARHTGAHAGLMRIASPFLGAWEDAMMSWSRLMYDDPKRLGALVKTWEAPERMGLIVDQDGNRVKPGDKARSSYVVVPLPGGLGKIAGVEALKINKNSWNSIFQGEVPWLPGAGPAAAIPAQQIATRAFPKWTDPNGPMPKVLLPFLRSVLNGDAPKVRPGATGALTDAVTGLSPSWAKKFFDAFNPTSPGFTNVFQDSWNSQIIAARQAGKPLPSQEVLYRNALSAARNTNIIKGVALGVLGMSSEGAGIQEFYSNQYNALYKQSAELQRQGTTVEQQFNRLFPEAAGLNFSVSKNETGITASLKVENRSRKYRKDIQANPEYGWFYVGSDNLGGAFSSAIYNAQSSTSLKPGSGLTARRRQTPADMADRSMASMGWDQYNQVQTKIDSILKDRGLHSLQQKGAADLAALKQQFVAQLSAQNHAWRDDHNSFTTGKLDSFIADVALPATKDPRLKNRSDIKLLSQYLALRAHAQDLAKANGFSLSSQKGANLAGVLAQAGQDFAAQNLGFGQIWNRVLSREVEDGLPN